MYIDDICADQIRAHIYLVIPNRDNAKDVAHDLLMQITMYEPSVAFKELHFIIPLLTQAEPLPEALALSESRIMAVNILTLWKQRYYTPYEGSYERWRVKCTS